MGHMKIILLFLLCGLLAGCQTNAKSADPQTDFFLIQASDLHVLSPEQFDDSALLKDIEAGGDGKQILASNQLFERFIDHVLQQRPDGVILSGDITFHGDLTSHQLVTAGLERLTRQNIAVYVLPGNHDWHTTPYAYFGNQAKRATATSREKFHQLYDRFGRDQAFSRDPASFSYAAEINSGTWLIMLDTAQPGMLGVISQATLDWLAELIEQARQQEIRLITVSHYNLFQHHELFERGFQMVGANQLQDLLAGYPPLIHLSGHLHIQHSLTRNNLTEVVTGAMAVWPHHVAHISQTGYQAVSLVAEDNQAWQADFHRTSLNRMLPRLEQAGVADPLAMAEFIALVNASYFSGDLTGLPDIISSQAARDWRARTEELRLGRYIAAILDELPIDHRIKEFYETHQTSTQ